MEGFAFAISTLAVYETWNENTRRHTLGCRVRVISFHDIYALLCECVFACVLASAQRPILHERRSQPQ